MPIPAYATFKDDSGGELKGSVTIAGREGSSEVMEFDHDVYIPTDANNGRLWLELIQHQAVHRRADPVEPGADQPPADPAARTGELKGQIVPKRLQRASIDDEVEARQRRAGIDVGEQHGLLRTAAVRIVGYVAGRAVVDDAVVRIRRLRPDPECAGLQDSLGKR